MLTSLVLVAAGCKDAHSELDEFEARQRYHGEPSSWACDRPWSHVVTRFYCENWRMRADELRPFFQLDSVRLDDAVFKRGRGARLDTVNHLELNRSSIETHLLVETFPRLERLSISGTAVDGTALRALGELTFLQLHLTAPPDATSLAAIPKLKTLWLTYVACPQPGCGHAIASQVRALRPELEIRVNE